MQPLLDVLHDHASQTDGDIAVRLELVRRLEILEREATQCRGLDTAGTSSVEVARQ